MAITTPFAQNGDKKEIPQTTSDGSLSYDKGFGSLYALPPEEGGLFIDREQFNQLVYQITEAILANQQSLSNLSGNVYNKGEVDNLVNAKANQSTTYTKTEVNNLLNAKANSNAVVALSGNQTINGVKTFSSAPVSATNPTANNQVANKAYVDSVANTKANSNAVVALSGNQTIAGTKTFSSPVVVPNGTANNHAVNLSQLKTKANANATVNLTGNQTIAGVKTFSAVPACDISPTANNHLANKGYVDSINQVPDYSAAISITPNKAFTPAFNGVVEIHADFNATGGISVSLGASSNRSKYILGCSSGVASGIFFGGQAIIIKGQQYYFSASIANLYRAIIAPFKSIT